MSEPPRALAHGSWPSPITADMIVGNWVALARPVLDGEDVYWSEGRPAEAGRTVLVRRTPDGTVADVTPPPWNVRSRVHEYGGGAHAVRDGLVVFSNDADARLYRLDVRSGSGSPQPLTPPTDGLAVRYADLVFDPARERLVCIRETHAGDGEAVNELVSVPLGGSDDGGRVLAGGADFYSSPAFDADGSRLAWLQWSHPNMPWDGTELWAGEVAGDGSVARARLVAGGPDVSVFQPRWSPDGSLVFVADQTGWWNLYRLRDPLGGGDDSEPEALWPREAEFGVPQWVFGQSTYAIMGDGRLLCAHLERGTWKLSYLDPAGGASEPGPADYPVVEDVQASGDRAVFIGSGPDAPATVVMADLGVHRLTQLRRSLDTVPDAGYLSTPRELEFPTTGDRTAFGLFYPPANRDASAPDGELPPLIVSSHGGPTGATDMSLNLGVQFWTSRGFAVLDVNYGGSTGHGRAYRERLNGNWGIVDVDDCVAGATFLADEGVVDPARLIIRGGSAGGYTTLAALAFRDVFAVGCSRFGISDLEALATDTHKFESRYLDRLVAPYPDGREVYLERSPIHHTDGLSCSLILFQGLEDMVVPPSQAERMFEAVRAKGLPVAYLAFEGEQHGFRKAENIKRTLEAELYFYGRVLGFDPADRIDPVEIVNLPARLGAP